jgi:alpha-tubulin suppressor-like RCC1 family protein
VRAIVVILLAGGLAVTACSHPAYNCNDSSQCVAGGVEGRCEQQGFCSFPDTACASGSRFENNAGGGLGGTCVPEGQPGDDAGVDGGATCGVVGLACCANNACSGNSFCDGGMCKQCVVDVAHGVTHSCFLLHDGSVKCAGEQDNGQLGNGIFSAIDLPTPVAVLDVNQQPVTDIVSMGLGENYSCAVRADKTVVCWGANFDCDPNGEGGQLGTGNFDTVAFATQVLREDTNQPLTDIVEVEGSFCATCARDSTGGVWCWGTNADGQLGDGTLVAKNRAVQVLTGGGPPLTGVVELEVGPSFACVRKSDDSVLCWGDNEFGQLGDTTTTSRDVPTTVAISAKQLAGGRFHNCVLLADGTAKCWGRGRHNRLGNGESFPNPPDQPSPVTVVTELDGTDAFSGIASIAAGSSSCLVTTAGDAYCWGDNQYGQTSTTLNVGVPTAVLDRNAKPLKNIARIVSKTNRTCAFTTTGDLLCWGRNSSGQLGLGTFDNIGLATPAGALCQ